MIVRELPDGLLCFRQLDHAALSGLLGDHWGSDVFPTWIPGDSVRLAVRRHDAGWPELDAVSTVDPETGRPLDYRTIGLDDRLDVAERSVARIAAIDPYAGWLVSRHFASFMEGSDAPEAIRWVVDQVGRRAGMLARSRARVGRDALHPHVLEANLDWLQLLDAVSLALCHDWNAWESRPTALEYGEETGVFRYRRVGSSGASIEGALAPWPFVAGRVVGKIPAVALPRATWESAEALGEAWEAAEEVDVEVALIAG
ncbi:MAG: DUF3891 family protein [Gemmatimonadetes bacterium]|nr:DUF3891 family protein [Gemmatimonadota bacterium]